MKRKILISLNLLIVILEIIATFLSIKEFSFKLFTYYTEYSNILTLITSFLLIICLFKQNIPNWVKFLRYITVHVMTITFLVVTFVLVPMLIYAVGKEGFLMFTKGSMLYHHTLCPIMLFISYALFEKWNPITKRDSIYVLIPTLVYGVIMAILNVYQVVQGPYPFLMVEEIPVYMTIFWIVIIFSLSYLVALTICKISRKKKIKVRKSKLVI